MTYKKLLDSIEKKKVRGAFYNGVKDYALEIVRAAMDSNHKKLNDTAEFSERFYLRGAKNWKHFSESALTSFTGYDISQRLCNPSELKKCKNGKLSPNPAESWLDVQTRALNLAWEMIRSSLLVKQSVK